MGLKNQPQEIQIVGINVAPSYMRFNNYIRSGYRTEATIRKCFQSIFIWSNESINIWTHLIGFFLFLYIFIHDWTYEYYIYKPSLADALVASFVLICFMACMLFSTLYHILNSSSYDCCCRWLSRDIFGISIAFFAIFISGIYYGFWCEQHQHLKYVYSSLAGILFLTAMSFVLIPRLSTEKWNYHRVLLFLLWALSGIIPTIHFVNLFSGIDQKLMNLFIPRILNMYLLSGSALLFYLFRFPECLLPGVFDYVGASHQIWHIIVVGALYYWHQTGILYAKYRQQYACKYDMQNAWGSFA